MIVQAIKRSSFLSTSANGTLWYAATPYSASMHYACVWVSVCVFARVFKAKSILCSSLLVDVCNDIESEQH